MTTENGKVTTRRLKMTAAPTVASGPADDILFRAMKRCGQFVADMGALRREAQSLPHAEPLNGWLGILSADIQHRLPALAMLAAGALSG